VRPTVLVVSLLAVAAFSTAAGLWAAQDSQPKTGVAPIQIQTGSGDAANRADRPRRAKQAPKPRPHRVQGAQVVSPPPPARAGPDDAPEPVDDAPAPVDDSPERADDAPEPVGGGGGGDVGRVEETDDDGGDDEPDDETSGGGDDSRDD
jgi:hypothetical protein